MSHQRLRDFISSPLWGELTPTVIAGPCSAESREQILDTAQALSNIGIKVFRAGAWKPRTYPRGFEGIGSEALPWLVEARQATGMLIGTEVGLPLHVTKALEHQLDFVWIGARTSASPFAITEIAQALRGSDITVLVKNPLTPSLDLWKGALLRLIDAGITRIGAIHRGFDIGAHPHFRNAPLWEQITQFRKETPGIPIYLDPSHIAGRREYLHDFVQISRLLHYDGLMIESHLEPDKALSDRKQQITPAQLDTLLKSKSESHEQALMLLRDELNHIDEKLLLLLSQRHGLSLELGRIKKQQGSEPYQEAQYHCKLKRIQTIAREYQLSEELVNKLYEIIHADSVDIQKKLP